MGLGYKMTRRDIKRLAEIVIKTNSKEIDNIMVNIILEKNGYKLEENGQIVDMEKPIEE